MLMIAMMVVDGDGDVNGDGDAEDHTGDKRIVGMAD